MKLPRFNLAVILATFCGVTLLLTIYNQHAMQTRLIGRVSECEAAVDRAVYAVEGERNGVSISVRRRGETVESYVQRVETTARLPVIESQPYTQAELDRLTPLGPGHWEIIDTDPKLWQKITDHVEHSDR